jgi:hypothetical protein
MGVSEEGLVECHRERYWLEQVRPRRLFVKEKEIETRLEEGSQILILPHNPASM